jgi:hypothetical protein
VTSVLWFINLHKYKLHVTHETQIEYGFYSLEIKAVGGTLKIFYEGKGDSRGYFKTFIGDWEQWMKNPIAPKF